MDYKIKERFGDWALITGASSGIGLSFAKALAAEGVDLVLVARRAEELRTLKAELERTYGIRAIAAHCDLSKEGFLQDIESALGGVEPSILVNNAGFGSSGAFHGIENAKDAAMVKVNCLAPVILTRRFLPGMVARKKGALVFLSSIVANQPCPLGATYSATKAFDLFLGEALHSELKGTGVAALTVKPGATRTGFQAAADYNEFKRARTGEDVVRTALRSLGRRRTVTDGFGNKLLGAAIRLMPRALAIASARAFTDSTRKKGAA